MPASHWTSRRCGEWNADRPPRQLQVSAKAQADPNNQKLAAQVETLVKGTTLRGMLQIALIAAIAAFAGAALMLVLSALGYRHLRGSVRGEEVLARLNAPGPDS